MNYLKAIVTFEQYAELNQLPDKPYRLWHSLMAINNACGWADWFTVPMIRLQSKLNTSSRQTIYNARNVLVQQGLLEFKAGKGNKAPSYHLIDITTRTENGHTDVHRSGHPGGQSNGHTDVHGLDTSVDHYINKTKLNKTTTELNLNKNAHAREGSHPVIPIYKLGE